MIHIAIVGYGQMGKLIASLADQYNMQVETIIDPEMGTSIEKSDLSNIDLAFEFTRPEAVITNLEYLLNKGIRTVTGTTGWYQQKDYVQSLVAKNQGSLLHGSNFSIGMNLFYHILEFTAELMAKNPEYDSWGLEKHHNRKVDSPSGTAKVLSDLLINKIPTKTIPQFEKLDRKIKPEEFHFASIRSGNIPGEHTIGFDSPADSIELIHRARNREGLALGAIKAGLWLTKHQGMFNFSDVFKDIIAYKS